MYMSVRELNEEQLSQLKHNIFYDWLDKEDFFVDHMIGILSYDDMVLLDGIQSPDEIPNEIVYKLYDGISFVDEDFWSVYYEE